MIERNIKGDLFDYLLNFTGEKIDIDIKYDEIACQKDVLAFEENKANNIKNYVSKVKESAPATPSVASSGSGNGKESKGTYRKSKDDASKGVKGAIYKNIIKTPFTPVKDVFNEGSNFAIRGEIFEIETRDLNNGNTIFTFSISDYTNSVGAKLFAKPDEREKLLEEISKGSWYALEGVVQYDTFAKELIMRIKNINAAVTPAKRKDNAKEKRVELHVHTTMSDMDGMNSAKSLIKTAMAWGHEAIAITDHGVLQAFPEAMETVGKDDFKILYGMEGYLVDDNFTLIKNVFEYDLKGEFIVFDLETTGLSYKYDKITEIGAVKVRDGQIVDTYSKLVNPEQKLTDKIIELTGITDDMLVSEPIIDDVLPEFLEFIGEAPVVAHNASFDTSFIIEECKEMGIEFPNAIVDTLTLSRLILDDLKRHKLSTIAKKLKIKLENHHRALDDAMATAHIFNKFVDMLADKEITDLVTLNDYGIKNTDYKQLDTSHIIIFAKNYVGLKNLYQMVSHSNIETYYKRPRIPKSLLESKKEGLILGTACEAGELYKAILKGKTDIEIEKIIAFYDYLEIQPLGNNQFLIEKGILKDKEQLVEINKKIVELGDKYDKPVVATCDVHFLNPEDEVYRRIIMAGKGFGDADNQPPLYLRTTEEMLQEFSYLGKEKCYEVVVTNTKKISDMIENILPIPSETSPPRIEGSDEELREMCNKKAISIYGDPLPDVVRARLDKELNSIISNGYAVMYIIAQKLVTKSLEDGYLVGSRGSVGSSLAATMSDITEINPLPPHYICGNCKYSEFKETGSLGSGIDLPDKVCPECGKALIKEGQDIPFETFLGFEGDKEPDIDLNFAGVYQANAHKYTEVLFGEGYVYKAGTIGTIADKTAFGYVKKYFEEKGESINSREVVRLSQGCTGIKRTSGQHPGGIMVVPDYKDIHDFCPIQFPANDTTSDTKTTHFDYHSISGRLLKLDILGHDVPTIIKHLEEMTGMDVTKEVPLDDPETIKIFTSVKPLKIVDSEYKLKIGSLAIPEFGTKFVRQMLVDTQPTTFSELVRISGLSHGTDVWINNAQNLVRDNVATLKDVISTRDDIMNYLIFKGLPPKDSFTIMERVRKGKGLTDENVEQMVENDVPTWYIDSCNTIKYMFPKAHAAAYVMMSFRIAYFKVHHPLAFYTSFFSIKVDDFDAEIMCNGVETVRRKMRELESMDKLSKKEEDIYTILEVCDEYYSRGLEFEKIDLYVSHSDVFKISGDKLLPPLRSLQGIGENAAKSIVEAASEKEFISVDDIRSRGKANRTAIDALRSHGCLDGMSESNQLSFI
jgi:DNA polymerase-3 subunit alpha (Gram-positive type)